MSEVILTIEGKDPLDLYVENNPKINLLKKAYPDVQITSRGNQVKIKGDKKVTEDVMTKLEIMGIPKNRTVLGSGILRGDGVLKQFQQDSSDGMASAPTRESFQSIRKELADMNNNERV